LNPAKLKAWIVALIKTNDPINVSGRVYPDQAPDGTVNPCVVYQLLGAEFDINIGSGLDDSLFSTQIRIYANSRSEADELRSGLAGTLLGSCGTEIATNNFITHTDISGFFDDFDPDDGSYGAGFIWESAFELRAVAALPFIEDRAGDAITDRFDEQLFERVV
jgi:hypothetical protein